MRALLALLFLAPVLSATQAQPTCGSLPECRAMALDAEAREAFEDFHTLAWRVVQTGPRNDPALMALLARAQSASGRPHDALIMLRRIAELGVGVADAETSAAFARVRALPGWPDVLNRIRDAKVVLAAEITGEKNKVEAPAAPPIPDTPGPLPEDKVTPPSVPPPSAAPAPGVVEGLAVPATVAMPAAMDYDAVSRRFVVADDSSHTLKVVDERSGNAVNLVSRGWAGPYRTTSLVIDHKRGDLWVAGWRDDNGTSRSAVHRLQLVSGRLLYAVTAPDDAGASRFTDVVMRGGAVLLLDAEGRRIFELAPGAKSLSIYATIDKDLAVSSMAPAANGIVYLAHARGVARLNAGTRASRPLQTARGVSVEGLQWLRYEDGALVGIQRQPDGANAAVRIRLDSQGVRAMSVRIIEPAAAPVGSVEGGALYFIGTDQRGGTLLRRVKLR